MGGARHALFRAGFSAIGLTGANRWLRPVAQGQGLILAFHRVRPWEEQAFAPNRFLEITPEFLERVIDRFQAAGFAFLPLDAVPERLARAGGDRPFVVFTFDDGYRDNLRHAWPVFRRRRVPWTVFLVPEFVDGTGVMWWLDLEALIAGAESLEFAIDRELIRLPAGSAREKHSAFRAAASRLMLANRQELNAFSAMVAERLGQEPGFHSRKVCADWTEIADLCRDGSVTIGAHSRSHPILSRLEPAEVEHEMRDSRAWLEQLLAAPIRHFAYPHGGPKEAGPREYALARDAGYVCAVTTRPGHLRPKHAGMLHALPRISMNGLHQTDSALDAIISGVPFLLAR